MPGLLRIIHILIRIIKSNILNGIIIVTSTANRGNHNNFSSASTNTEMINKNLNGTQDIGFTIPEFLSLWQFYDNNILDLPSE